MAQLLVIKRIIVIVSLLAFHSSSVIATSSHSDEARIKAIVKQVFVIEDKAKAKKVEFEGQSHEAKTAADVISELEEYVSNKQGYIDRLKHAFAFKGADEKLSNASIKKVVYKDFDFKSIEIIEDLATVAVDVSWEMTNRMGGQTSVFIKRDDSDNAISADVQDSPEKDVVFKGTTSWTITLEKNDNKWQMLSKEGQF